jgi:hypothetical protein
VSQYLGFACTAYISTGAQGHKVIVLFRVELSERYCDDVYRHWRYQPSTICWIVVIGWSIRYSASISNQGPTRWCASWAWVSISLPQRVSVCN